MTQDTSLNNLAPDLLQELKRHHALRDRLLTHIERRTEGDAPLSPEIMAESLKMLRLLLNLHLQVRKQAAVEWRLHLISERQQILLRKVELAEQKQDLVEKRWLARQSNKIENIKGTDTQEPQPVPAQAETETEENSSGKVIPVNTISENSNLEPVPSAEPPPSPFTPEEFSAIMTSKYNLDRPHIEHWSTRVHPRPPAMVA
ncbi:MAG: hypothetical protein SFY81_12675 [Verrucomicrobiota bacterium]|nr:hypothetical protein [Verrucomicrobiota bacterium]